MPQSSSNRLPAASTKYFEPVTVPAAPRKVSFAIGLSLYRGALRRTHSATIASPGARFRTLKLGLGVCAERNSDATPSKSEKKTGQAEARPVNPPLIVHDSLLFFIRRGSLFVRNDRIDVQAQALRHSASICWIGFVKVLYLQLLNALRRVAKAANDVADQPRLRIRRHQTKQIPRL